MKAKRYLRPEPTKPAWIERAARRCASLPLHTAHLARVIEAIIEHEWRENERRQTERSDER